MALAGLKEHLRILSRSLHRHYLKRDIEGMDAVMQQVIAAAELVEPDSERDRAVYESIVVFCSLKTAELRLDNLDYTNCLLQCREAHELLVAKGRRQADLERPAKDSERWANLCSVLADAKWKGPAEIKDSILSPGQLADRWMLTEANLADSLVKYRVSKAKSERLLENVSWCGLAIIKLAMRWLPQRVAELRDTCSNYHGDGLDREDHHYYWDLKIAEAFFDQTLTKELFARYSAMRLVRLTNHSGQGHEMAAYKYSTDNEGQYLLSQMPSAGRIIQYG